jgi:hypothetical protein
LRIDLLNGPNGVRASFEDGNKSSSRNTVFFRIPDDGQSQKTCNPEITCKVSIVAITSRQAINNTFGSSSQEMDRTSSYVIIMGKCEVSAVHEKL